MEKQKVILIDIDGTIANIDHRKHLILGETPDWDAFYKACVDDTPIVAMIKVIKGDLEGNSAIPVFVTGRSDLVRRETAEWLDKYFFDGDLQDRNPALHMRVHGDHQEDFELKKGFVNSLSEFEILGAYEDRPQVIRMYEELKIPVIDTGPGYEF